MKITTWNVNSINARLDHLLDFIKKNQSDIISFIDSNKKNIENVNIENHQGKKLTSVLLKEKQINILYSLSKYDIDGLSRDLNNNNKSLAFDIGINFSLFEFSVTFKLQ